MDYTSDDGRAIQLSFSDLDQVIEVSYWLWQAILQVSGCFEYILGLREGVSPKNRLEK